jgi:hypothetical protein
LIGDLFEEIADAAGRNLKAETELGLGGVFYFLLRVVE